MENDEFESNWKVVPARPGEVTTIVERDPEEKWARIRGQVKAVEAGGWAAFVYGSCQIVNNLTGEKYTITVTKE